MADPEQLEENTEDLLAIDESNNTDETKAKDGKPEEPDEAENVLTRKNGPGVFSGFFNLLWKRKRIVIFIMIPLVALIVFGRTINERYFKNVKAPSPPPNSRTISLDSLNEENLSPFFIPLTNYQNRRMVRVDLSVIWSFLASVKYKKNRLQIRDRMFDDLRLFFRDTRDLANGSNLIEDNLKEIFQKVLGIYDLEVKVREINYF